MQERKSKTPIILLLFTDIFNIGATLYHMATGRKPLPVYDENKKLRPSSERFPFNSKDIKTDVLIIGGGIAGILTAFLLSKNNVDYVSFLNHAKTNWSAGGEP